MTPKQQRYARLAQARHRKSRISTKTELENAQILLAWEAQHLTEHDAAKALTLEGPALHQLRADAIRAGMVMAGALLPY